MKVGRVCGKHNQWCPDGECPYCPATPAVETVKPPTMTMPPLQQQSGGWILPGATVSFLTAAPVASYILSNSVWRAYTNVYPTHVSGGIYTV